MEIEIDAKSREPIFEQLVRQIREQIENGKLKAEEKLPAVKELADRLGISRLTTGKVYEELCKEGLIDRLGGHGSFAVHGRS